MGLESTPIFHNGQMTKCPTCGSSVRLIFHGKNLDHLEHIDNVDKQLFAAQIAGPDAKTVKEQRRQRNGKRTVAIVGLAPATCAFAPFNEPDVGLGKHIEIWGLNESHDFSWFKNWTRWFQLHPKEYFSRAMDPKRGVKFHYDWLKEKHNKPIYMQYVYPEIPDSVEYPLQTVVNKFFGKMWHGDEQPKFFNSSVDYMIALALLEGKFDRIELYGVEMANDTEYVYQKSGATFWMGVARGMGVEVYFPKECRIMSGPLYAYQGQGPRNEV
jgi:hypothetical protein